jgi:short-subunit dehydrogenase
MIAVITGGTKGIGLAIIEELAKSGYEIITCSRNQEDINALTKRIAEEYSVPIHGFAVDLSDKNQVIDFSNIIKKIGPVSVLVNNAGVFLPGEISKEAAGNLELMIETNLYSAYYLTRALLPEMVSNNAGHIFNICSIASKIAYPNGGSYSISKFALLGFSKVLREEMKPHGIKVTSILPGATWSNSWAGVDLPEERLMQASDIAKLVSNALSLSSSANVEEIIIRPQLGDL